MGLSLVLSTSLSMFLSHMSLMVQPAPLMTKAPTPKMANMWRSGSWPAGVARQSDQPQGQNSSQVPMGLSSLARRRKGWTGEGREETREAASLRGRGGGGGGVGGGKEMVYGGCV